MSKRAPAPKSTASAPEDNTGAIGNVVGAIAILVAVLLGLLSTQTSWQVAYESGALDKPTITLGVGGYRLDPRGPITVVVGIPKLSENGTVAIGSIPFTLTNEGMKTVDTPTLTLRFHKLFKREGLQAMTYGASGPYSATQVKASFTQDEPFDYVSYQAPALDPKVDLTVNEPFYAHETRIRVDTPVVTKDNVSGTVTVTMVYSLTFLATVTARDVGAVNYPIDIAVTHASSMDDLIAFAKNNLVDRQASEFRTQLGFVKYLAGLLFRTEVRKLYVVYETSTEQHVIAENKVLEFAKKPQQTGRIEYSLLSWGRLFQ
jgi:hypothetical protein